MIEEVTKLFEKEFTYERVLENLCRYELYYQISLKYLVRVSEFDMKSTVEKLDEIHLEIDPETVFYTVIAILRHLDFKKSQKDLDEEFEASFKKHAIVQALEDYIKKDEELTNSQYFMKSMLEPINENLFFTEAMQREFDDNYQINLNRWKDIISKPLSEEIRKSSMTLLES